MLKRRIEQDLKDAMLGGDKQRVSTLRILKSAILYVEVAKGSRETGLTDPEVVDILLKESKKRQEAADLYQKAAENERAEAELTEKAIIDTYLPKQLSDEELERIIKEVIESTGSTSIQQMGQVIAEVKKRVGGSAAGARVALIVKEGLQ
jgi:uncharacterized protein